MPRFSRSFLIALYLISGMAWVAPGHSALAEVPLPNLRAAMVFNFIKFTEWPEASREGDLTICVSSSDDMLYSALAGLEGRRVRSMTLRVVRLPGHDAATCEVIYSDSRQRWERALEARGASHALSISHYPGFSDDGGMIEIVTESGTPQFDVNLAEARRAGLRLYPQLLKLARIVRE